MNPGTCKNLPIKDTSGLSYDNCASVTSTHTMDTGGHLHAAARSARNDTLTCTCQMHPMRQLSR